VTRVTSCALPKRTLWRAKCRSAWHGIGINAGEPIAEGDDLFGSAVILAAGLADPAGGGQVVVADVVRQLVGGKVFVFAELGQVLAGFKEPVRIWEFLW
jgi:class 3 adenylate cyclase